MMPAQGVKQKPEFGAIPHFTDEDSLPFKTMQSPLKRGEKRRGAIFFLVGTELLAQVMDDPNTVYAVAFSDYRGKEYSASISHGEHVNKYVYFPGVATHN